MKEYIERAVAIKRIKEYSLTAYDINLDNKEEFAGNSLPENYCEGLYEATELLDDLPTADVAEVVRCKDCQYYQDAKTNKKGFLICPASGMEITETDYCSYGARMDKEDEHEAD